MEEVANDGKRARTRRKLCSSSRTGSGVEDYDEKQVKQHEGKDEESN